MRFGAIEGYLALFFALVFVLAPVCLGRRQGDFELEAVFVYLAIWACAWLFAGVLVHIDVCKAR